MDLISILWMTVGIVALVFSIDALLTRFLFGERVRLSAPSRITTFGVMMLLFAAGCFIIFLYESTT